MAYAFTETEEQKILRDTIRSFAEKRIAPQAQALDEKEEFSLGLTQEMGELGLLGATVKPQYGGHGMDTLSYIIAVEELARVDGSQAATVAAHNSLGCGPISMFGTDEQKAQHLPSLCDGTGLWAFGLTEAEAGSDAQASRTTATLDPRGDYVLEGTKIWITNSACPLTKGITVQAVTGRRPDGRAELSCFLIPSQAQGLECKPMKGKMMWRASNTGELIFRQVRVPASALLGKQGEGFKVMMATLDRGRLSIGAMGLGLAKGAYALSLAYAKERRTFGKTLSQHQAIAFKLADIATRIEASENMLYKACVLKDQGAPFEKLAAMAKLYCSETAELAAREGQQIFGGYGLMKESPIERFYRDAALLRIGEGTSEIQRLVIARYEGC